MAKRIAQVCLIHGADTVAVQKARDNVVNSLLPAELRDENLTDIISTSNRALRLADIGWDVVSELSTLSLFADSRRVIVVTDLRDLCETSRKKPAKKKTKKGKAPAKSKDVTDKFCEFLGNGLLQTPNAIVFVNYEKDYESTVSKRSLIYKTIGKTGFVQACRGENKVFALADALEAQDSRRAIELFRSLGKSVSPNMMFNQLLKTTRLLLQARTAEIKRRGGMTDKQLEELFPQDRSGLFKQHPYVQKKTARAASRFSPTDLAGALKELVEINRIVIPVSTDVYVREFAMATELWILKWYSRKR